MWNIQSIPVMLTSWIFAIDDDTCEILIFFDNNYEDDDLLSDDDDDDDLSRHSRNERRSSSPPRRSDVGWNEGYAEDSVGGGGGVDYRGGEVRDYGGGDEPGHRGGTGDSQGYGGGDTGGPYPREYFEEGRVAPFQDHNWNDLQMKDNNYRHESEPAG